VEIIDSKFAVDGVELAGTTLTVGAPKLPSVLSLHGAGQSTRNRIRYLLMDFLSQGIGAFCFDFSGHGDSAGALSDSSLLKRQHEAMAATRFVQRDPIPLIIGSSMGAHTAAVMTGILSVGSLVLFCPAAYAAEATDKPFDSRFSDVIRKPNSFLNSPAFSTLHEFTGNLIVICGANDKTIPREVVDLYYDSAKRASSRELIWVEDAGHQIHTFLETHPDVRENIVRKIIANMK
jgi:pimeloyl-ACP methyl ester carboxylesterase